MAQEPNMTVLDFNPLMEAQDFDPALVDQVLAKARGKKVAAEPSDLESMLFQRAGAARMLSAKDEADLFDRLLKNNDQSAEGVLMASFSRLVLSIARQHLGYGIPLVDLVQEGNMGLLKAIRRFEPERGWRLSTMATQWIGAEIKEYALKNTRIVKIATTKAQRKLFFNLRSAKSNLRSGDSSATAGLNPQETDRIAKLLCVKPAEVLEMERRLSGGDWGFDMPWGDPEDGFSLAERLTDEADTPEGNFEKQRREWLQHQGVAQALQTLDERSQRIVSARWIEVTDEGVGLTLHDLAEEFSISPERIRQIEKAALKKMRGELA